MSRRVEAAVTAVCLTGVLLAGLVIGAGWFDPGHASVSRTKTVQPYGGCKEAQTAPHSVGAKQCRQMGWTIRRGLAVNAHGVVRVHDLPHCREEDGSAQRTACTWNIGWADGNGQGLSYWMPSGTSTRARYVWPERPLGQPTPSALADALAEGMVDEDWDRCWLDEARTHVRCPDGYITRVHGQK